MASKSSAVEAGTYHLNKSQQKTLVLNADGTFQQTIESAGPFGGDTSTMAGKLSTPGNGEVHLTFGSDSSPTVYTIVSLTSFKKSFEGTWTKA